MSRDAIVPVSFEFGPASAGWIGLRVRTGGQSDVVSCSNVYDSYRERWGDGTPSVPFRGGRAPRGAETF